MSETRTIPVTDTNPHECTPDHDCEHHEGGHEHGPECGHEAVQHGDHVDECKIAVDAQNPAACAPVACECKHDECGHEKVPHGDHFDYLVAGRLHHPHGDHCDHHGPADSA